MLAAGVATFLQIYPIKLFGWIIELVLKLPVVMEQASLSTNSVGAILGGKNSSKLTSFIWSTK